MYVVEVTPLARGISVDTLSYYAAEAFRVGDIVEIPVRKRTQLGLVVSVVPVSVAKAALRAATFSLRKLTSTTPSGTLPPLLQAIAQELSREIPATTGAILYALLPPEIRDGTVQAAQLPAAAKAADTAAPEQIGLLADTEAERFRVYKRRIREAFARGGSVLFFCPTAADLERAVGALAKGIEDRTVVFSPLAGSRARKRQFTALNDHSQSRLILATPQHHGVDRDDVVLIICEQCRSPFYRARTRPYLDTRDVLTHAARRGGRRVLFGDLLPPSEFEAYRRREQYASEESPRRYTFQSKAKIIQRTPDPNGTTPFSLFTPEVTRIVTNTLKARRNLFILAARRGLAPVVACADCGSICRSPYSGAPYSLFAATRGNEVYRYFIDPLSGKRVRAYDHCKECGSWRLRERGIGIQHIEAELQRLAPQTPRFLFDHTTATTYKRALTLMEDFRSTKGAILLATPMVFPFLTEPIYRTIIPSLDALRSIPTWRADEELFATLLSLRERTSDTMYLQSTHEPGSIAEYATQGQIAAFYDEELALREQVGYPPYAVLIHLTMRGAPGTITALEETVTDTVAPLSVHFYNGFSAHTHQSQRYGLIRVPTSEWPNSELMDKLRTLPPSIRIEVNPSRLI